MAKVEASLPFLAKEGCKEIKKMLKIKAKLLCKRLIYNG
jgi:hypothetical protein